MVTTLYLIRHGETEGSGTKRYKGSIDVPLSERGVRQIREASSFIMAHLKNSCAAYYESYLRDVHAPAGEAAKEGTEGSAETRPVLSAVYCSSLGRAVRSAGIIAEPHGLEPVTIPDLRERSFGIWEGMSFTEIREKYPAEFEAWAENPVCHSPLNGESTRAVSERVLRAFGEILERHGAKGKNGGPGRENIAIIAHGGVNRILLCHIMGIPLENVFRIEQDHAAVNIIEFWERYPVVKLLNGGPLG
ncbi:MAG: histidine phosphatase family protein [Alphaproteobacteria bacterium]|uniref:Histidine phosphatase family protein n=1 Tax=Candidatus Nitrobium versatile TaxID=2884831 RepID=A0A953SHV2_9BACT|nr:histidine phosphatase family protein [Candidatus Nitrobium versatile]